MISAEFKQNVESGDLITVRSALLDYLIIDRTFKKFDDALEYACTKLNIMQPYDNNPFEMESCKWDNAYLNHQKVALMVNFSKKIIEHIKNVIKIVMADNIIQKTETVLNQTYANGSYKNHTGRINVSEKIDDYQNDNLEDNRTFHHDSHKLNSESSASQNTGQFKTYRSEKRIGRKIHSKNLYSEKNNKTEVGIGIAVVVGGVVIAAAGLSLISPIVVGTGIVIVGAGVVIKVKKK